MKIINVVAYLVSVIAVLIFFVWAFGKIGGAN